MPRIQSGARTVCVIPSSSPYIYEITNTIPSINEPFLQFSPSQHQICWLSSSPIGICLNVACCVILDFGCLYFLQSFFAIIIHTFQCRQSIFTSMNGSWSIAFSARRGNAKNLKRSEKLLNEKNVMDLIKNVQSE